MYSTGGCGSDYSRTVFAKIEPIGKPQLFAVADGCGSINLQWQLAAGINDFAIEYLSSLSSQTGVSTAKWEKIVTRNQLSSVTNNNYVVDSIGGMKLIPGQSYNFRISASG